MPRKLMFLTLLLTAVLTISAVLTIAVIDQGSNAILQAARAYFPQGYKMITADALYKLLSDGNTANDPLVLDIRLPTDYALGHIPGAVSISAADIFTPTVLSQLPEDKPIVIVGYNGQALGQAATALSLAGYDGTSLRFGMPAWAIVPGVSVPPFSSQMTMNYPVGKDKVPLPTQTYAAPQPLGPDVASAALAYFSQGAKSITAEELHKLLNDEDKSNDPLVIDIRRPDDYAQGHIPGAVNILGPDVFTPATLAVLPTDRKIVVSCYTAQTASQVVAALNLLGYDAYTLEHAMCSWAVPQGVPNSCWDDKMSRNYPVSTEPVKSPLASKRIDFGTNRASG